MEIIVDSLDPDIGKRLDLYISLKLPKYTRSLIKKTIESNEVFVNNEINYKAGYKVKINDRILFPEINDYKNTFVELKPSLFDLKILLEDDDYVFLDKPIGLLVHPVNNITEDTLVNKLISKYKDLPGENMNRPGIVHRLDKDTSGVIVVAKNPKSLWWISKLFAERKVNKEYLSIGICHGLPKIIELNKTFEVSGYLKRSDENRKKYVLNTKSNDGKYSLTSFKALKILNYDEVIKLVLFQVSPSTGRTHQIRVHQKSLSVSILGDPLYLSRNQCELSNKILNQFNIKPRLFLHAHKINFENYDGKVYSVLSEMPKEFNELLT